MNRMQCICLVIGALCAVGCSPQPVEAPRRIVTAHGDAFFPNETLADWVSFARQVSEVTVLSEREIPPPKGVLERKEGYIARSVRLRVDRNLWVEGDGKNLAPTEFEIFVAGWLLKGDSQLLIGAANSPRVELNGRYIMPLTQVPDAHGGVVWAPLTPDSVMAYPGDKIAEMDVAAMGTSGVARAYAQRPVEELSRALAQTAMHPSVASHRDLLPYERYKLSDRAR
jgi:hypothetical protein